MRAVVIGAAGQVGAALVAGLRRGGHAVLGTHYRVTTPDTEPLDVTDAAAVERQIARAHGGAVDYVFCPAGLTAVDYCEDHPDDAFRVNRDAAGVAARAAARRGAGFVYYSTEYVFDGTAGPYAEDAPVAPLSVYGRSKLEGEQLVAKENPKGAVIRTTVAYGPEPQGKNFVCQVLRRGRAGEAMRAPNDQRSSPTYNEDLAEASIELAARAWAGVINVVGPEVLDRYAFGRLVCEVFGLDPGFLTPVATASLGQKAPRPLRAGLAIGRARALLKTPLRGPREGLGAMRAALVG
ncbi:MAG: SDR family oxidoreductase [Candidatus Rokubacteria bacterium]|nr:SDR family oxidoreductase [Candidatus Rokubacteria bacterium]